MRAGKSKGKVAFWVVYMLFMLGVGALAGLFIRVWYGWILFMLALVPLVLGADGLSKRLWPKPVDPEKREMKPELLVKKLIRTILQMFMGGAFGGGVVGLILQLIHGGDVAPFLGLIGLSIVLLIILAAVPFVQDQETKDEIDAAKKEMQYKDERVAKIGYKAGQICFGVTLALLLLFGAFLTVFPPVNFNVIPVGILGIIGISAILYTVLVVLFGEEKLDVEADLSVQGRMAIFLISLIPPTLLGIWWAMEGLSSMGITFFAAFLFVTLLAAWELWFARKYR